MILKAAGYDPPTPSLFARMDADSDGRISLKELENVPGKQTWKISFQGCLSFIDSVLVVRFLTLRSPRSPSSHESWMGIWGVQQPFP